LDKLDKIIVAELSRNCRISYSLLASKYNVSVNTIKNRINRLIKKKIILGFSVKLKSELFNANTAITIIKEIKKPAEDKRKVIGSHRLVNAVSFGVDSGFIIFEYTKNEEFSDLIDFVYEAGYDDVVAYPIFLPLSIEVQKPTKNLHDLQHIDFLILYHLKDDGRMSLSKLSEKTRTSVPTIRKRLQYLRKHNMIDESIKLNPGMLQEGMMVIFEIHMKKLNSQRRIQIEQHLRKSLRENFWVSWQVVDRPIIILAFQISNTQEIGNINEKLVSAIIPEQTKMSFIIGGEIEYFGDYQDDFFEDKKRENWFPSSHWKK
jgi:DNA-binding Lrp family transcriptional regulator